MAGTNPAFDAAEFRTAIRDTMTMGMPTATSKRLTWHWNRDQTFDPQDPAATPYDLDQAPVVDDPGNPDEPSGEVQVTYALEFAARPAGSRETVFGQFDTSRAEVTLLEDEYEQIKTADYCTIDGTRYEIDFTAPPVGLFEVTVYTIYITAEDEGGEAEA